MPREFWARGDSSNANNASLNATNTNQQPTILLTFEATDGGDEKLDYNDGDPDPDTVVWADYDGDGVRDPGEEMNFTVEFIGFLPGSGYETDGPNGSNLNGEKLMVVTLQDGTRLWFFIDSDGSPEWFDAMDNFPNGAHTLDSVSQICYAMGTRIDTPTGVKLVENIEPGDKLLTSDGAPATVLFLARQSHTEAEVRSFKNLRPVVIPAGAIENGVPETDLTVSPLHRILIRDPNLEHLFGQPTFYVAARDVPGARPGPREAISYVHILCDRHAPIIANGCVSESLFPGDVALSALNSDEREKILSIVGSTPQSTAYPCLTSREASVWRAEAQRRAKRSA